MSEPKYAGTMKSMPASYRDPLVKIGAALGMSDDAALALGLCQEVLRDYVRPEERVKVIAALFGIENHRRTSGDKT
jgi:hypothetical protein